LTSLAPSVQRALSTRAAALGQAEVGPSVERLRQGRHGETLVFCSGDERLPAPAHSGSVHVDLLRNLDLLEVRFALEHCCNVLDRIGQGAFLEELGEPFVGLWPPVAGPRHNWLDLFR
jgi:hypothetical protein